jgi:regulator of nonsense transcripts 1
MSTDYLVGQVVFLTWMYHSKQLRPTVKRMAGALEYDLSLLERLYEGVNQAGMRRIMLDVSWFICPEC